MTESKTKKLFLEPMPGHILVEVDGFKQQGRIIIPENVQRRPTTGTIVAKGLDVLDLLEIGLRVVFGLYSGTVIDFKGQPHYRALRADEILCVITEEAPKDLELEGVGA